MIGWLKCRVSNNVFSSELDIYLFYRHASWCVAGRAVALALAGLRAYPWCGHLRPRGGDVAAFDMRSPPRIYMRVPGRADAIEMEQTRSAAAGAEPVAAAEVQ